MFSSKNKNHLRLLSNAFTELQNKCVLNTNVKWLTAAD